MRFRPFTCLPSSKSITLLKEKKIIVVLSHSHILFFLLPSSSINVVPVLPNQTHTSHRHRNQNQVTITVHRHIAYRATTARISSFQFLWHPLCLVQLLLPLFVFYFLIQSLFVPSLLPSPSNPYSCHYILLRVFVSWTFELLVSLDLISICFCIFFSIFDFDILCIFSFVCLVFIFFFWFFLLIFRVCNFFIHW